MANATVTFIGADNGVTTALADERALFLKMFAGEILTAFPEYTIFIDKHRVKPIENGKSAQFPLIGRMPAAEYHTPGAEILGQEAPLGEVEISVDRLLISHLFVDNLDQKLAHFEARGEIAKNMSRRLSQTYDNHVARNLILAANTTATIAADSTMGGTVITDTDLVSATAQTKLDAWVENLFAARKTFDDKWVNDGTIWCAMLPEDYYFLVQNAMSSGYALIDQRIDGAGSLSKGKITELAGVQLISFPGLPTSNYGAEDFHNVDCSNTAAIVWTRSAVGTVKAFDIGVETEYQISRQGTLVVAKYAMGHGVLQAECAIQFKSA
jgi:hypothetical protein